jgi:tetratricopeptide (TPR) repeat protein
MQVLGAHHHHPGALEVLGTVFSSQGHYEDAVRVFNALTLMQPSVAAHWQNLGTVLRPTGRHAQSLQAFEHALRLGGPNAGLLYNLGALQMDRLDYRAARLALRDAVALAPREAQIRWTYAQCCYDIGQRQEAVSSLQDWVTLDGLSVEITVSIALLLVTSGAARLAQPAVQRLLVNPPTSGRAAVGFALLLERLHRLDEAHAVLQRLEREEHDLSLNSERLAMCAVLAARTGHHEDCYRLLTLALAEHPGTVHRYDLLYPLAASCDALGRYDEAYTAAAQAHALQLEFLELASGKSSEEHSQLWALTEHGCCADDIACWESSPASEGSPIFVVGFPRSGTTLLEQMLDAHPMLQSMDEQPFLLRAVARISARGIRYPIELGRLTNDDVMEMRARYWEDVRTRVPLSSDRRLVEKNPLNMALLPVMRRLFPDSPIILVLRHPCDTVLSCFLQHFPSDLALLGRDLTSLARSYARAFAYWDSQCSLLRPTTYEFRYEQLVMDFPGEVDRICAFLQLQRHEAMLTPGRHAQTKGFISTPSYAQVLEPISSRSVGRWRNYERYFSTEALAVLRPWIKRWGYSLA